MAPRTGGEWVVDALRVNGVRHVFGIPGIHNLPVYDALLRQRDIVHVLARHEAGAAFMADGYARASGEPGVVVVTTGPGATNTITPLAESYAGSMPVIVVMSDVATHLLGRDLGALHEVPDQIRCFQPVTRMAETLTEISAIAPTIAGAFALGRTGRPGPVALSIPNDLLFARADGPEPRAGEGRRPPCHVADVAAAADRLRRARRPLVITGGGVVSAGAEAELVAVVRRLGAPVVTTVMGRGAMDERDPLWHSVLPDRRATTPVLQAADVILAVGCRFAHRSAEKLGAAVDPGQCLVHMDIDPAMIGRLFKAQVPVVGDARDGLARLLAALGPTSDVDTEWDRAWLARVREDAGPRYTPEIAEAIGAVRAALPADGIVVGDQTGLAYWMEWRFPVRRPRTFLYPVGSATLGYALPAAIGAAFACPGRPILSVSGDGGFLFSVGELATAVKYRLPVVFLVVDDGRLGAIKWLQERLFEGRWGEADLVNPDFTALARAFGARAERVAGLADLQRALETAFARGGPSVLTLGLSVDPPWDL